MKIIANFQVFSIKNKTKVNFSDTLKLTEVFDVYGDSLVQSPLNLAIGAVTSVYNIVDNLALYVDAVSIKIKELVGAMVKKITIPFLDYDDIIKDEMIILSYIEQIMLLGRRHNVEVVFIPNYKHKLNIFTHLFTKIKKFNLLFSLSNIALSNQSITTSYRLLKNNISIIDTSDIDESGLGTLLGYGICDIVDFFKKLNRDSYSGDIIYTCNLLDLYHSTKTNPIKLFFSPSQRKANSFLREKLNLKSLKDLSFEALYGSQINVLKTMTRNL
jgi:hypothetical protein